MPRAKSETQAKKTRPKGRLDKLRQDAAARRLRVLDLKKLGHNNCQIAARVGVSEKQVRDDLKAIFDYILSEQQETAREMLALSHLRLEMSAKAIAPQIEAGDLQAIDRWLKVIDHQCKLFRLYEQPPQVKESVIVEMPPLAPLPDFSDTVEHDSIEEKN